MPDGRSSNTLKQKPHVEQPFQAARRLESLLHEGICTAVLSNVGRDYSTSPAFWQRGHCSFICAARQRYTARVRLRFARGTSCSTARSSSRIRCRREAAACGQQPDCRGKPQTRAKRTSSFSGT